ncbi:MAG: hypothetical protein ACE5L6_05135 [Candidatus Bathyarchaeia archaeon]
MQLLDMLTINEEPKSKEGLLETIWKAFDYFPRGIWEEIRFVGNIIVKYDLKIKTREKIYGAFIFNNLMRKIREIKNVFESRGLLLAVTYDPVISVYHQFELESFKRIINLVRDYVSRDVGMLSLFEILDETATRVAAHGLGHNQGLKHHVEPIDLMYGSLLDGHSIKRDGFCDECREKLRSNIAS